MPDTLFILVLSCEVMLEARLFRAHGLLTPAEAVSRLKLDSAWLEEGSKLEVLPVPEVRFVTTPDAGRKIIRSVPGVADFVEVKPLHYHIAIWARGEGFAVEILQSERDLRLADFRAHGLAVPDDASMVVAPRIDPLD